MPDLQDVANEVERTLDVSGVVILVHNKNRTMSFVASNGIGSHAEANSLLCLGIHLNLSQHDAMVLQGAAGAEAQTLAESLEVSQ